MIVFIGESGSGKTTMEKELEKRGFKRTISYTTRKPRAHEVDGVHYHFVDEETFLALLASDFFAEVGVYNGNYYGTALEDCTDDKVAVVEPQGLFQLKDNPKLNVTAIYLKAKPETRFYRMMCENRSLSAILERLMNDYKTFEDIEKEVDFIVESEGFILDIVSKVLEVINERA